jgi:6-phosphogluconolactonase
MELVHAPVPELKNLLTQSFEGWAQEGRSCALSGGATALIFLPALRAAKVDWARITLFWADERAVPADDPESNYGIAERMLLSPLGAKAPRAIRMPADLPHLGDAAVKYDDVLAAELEGRALDLALLGVGEDGHVASIFKSAQGAQNAELRVMAVEDAPKPPKRRLSLTLSYLLQTRKIWVVAVGPRKLPVLQAALSKTQRSTALDVVLHQVKDVTVFTDQVIRRR